MTADRARPYAAEEGEVAVGVIEIVGVVVVVVAIGVIGVNAWTGAVRGTSWQDWFGRSGRTTTNAPSFPRTDRYRVAKALSRGQDIPPEDMSVATAVAKNAQPPLQQVALLGLPLLVALVGILTDRGGMRWLNVATVALLVLTLVLGSWRTRQLLRGYNRMVALHPLRAPSDDRRSQLPDQPGGRS